MRQQPLKYLAVAPWFNVPVNISIILREREMKSANSVRALLLSANLFNMEINIQSFYTFPPCCLMDLVHLCYVFLIGFLGISFSISVNQNSWSNTTLEEDWRIPWLLGERHSSFALRAIRTLFYSFEVPPNQAPTEVHEFLIGWDSAARHGKQWTVTWLGSQQLWDFAEILIFFSQLTSTSGQVLY